MHCSLSHLNSGHLTVLQPRFERGCVSRCVSNDLQLAVHDSTDLILFLPGQIGIYDLFESAPEGKVNAIWQTPNCDKQRIVTQPSQQLQNLLLVKVTTGDPEVVTPEKATNNRRSPFRSAPSSTSDHNKDATSPVTANPWVPGDALKLLSGAVNPSTWQAPIPKPTTRLPRDKQHKTNPPSVASVEEMPEVHGCANLLSNSADADQTRIDLPNLQPTPCVEPFSY